MTTTMSIKIDDELKRQAKQTASAIGIPLSTLINAYLREVVATGKVEFSATESITPQMERVIEQARREIAAGEVSPEFSSARDAIKWLHDPKAKLQNGHKVH